MDWATFKARRQEAPATARVPLCADGNAVRAMEEAREVGDIDALAVARKAVAAATMHIPVRALDPDDFIALKDTHRPKDPAKIQRGDEWDLDTFGPALLAASLDVDSPIAAEDVPDLWGTVTAGERMTLFFTCRDLNETIPDLGFTKPDTATTPGIGQSLTTAAATE